MKYNNNNFSDFGSQFLKEENEKGPSLYRKKKGTIIIHPCLHVLEPTPSEIRAYEVQKRKCYFAIVTASDISTASALYKELDGFQIEGASDVIFSFSSDFDYIIQKLMNFYS